MPIKYGRLEVAIGVLLVYSIFSIRCLPYGAPDTHTNLLCLAYWCDRYSWQSSQSVFIIIGFVFFILSIFRGLFLMARPIIPKYLIVPVSIFNSLLQINQFFSTIYAIDK